MSDQEQLPCVTGASKEPEIVDFWSLQCERLLGIPGWCWYKIEGVIGGTLITGAVPNGVFKSGPRKGETNWAKADKSTERRIVISAGDALRFRLEWERDHGKCHECLGSGRAWCGWSKSEGNRFRTCVRCGGSGSPPVERSGGS